MKEQDKPDRSELRSKIRAGYIQGSDLTVVAIAHGVPYSTAVSWKKQAKDQGDDWDIARRARQVAGGGAAELFGQILEEVGTQYMHTLKLIKGDGNINVATKGELLVKMVDGLSKAAKLAGLVNPEVNEIAIAVKVIQSMNEYIAENHAEHRRLFVDILSGFGEELPQRLGLQS